MTEEEAASCSCCSAKQALASARTYYIHMEVYLIENGTDAVLGDPGTRHASLRVPRWEKIQAQLFLLSPRTTRAGYCHRVPFVGGEVLHI